MRRAPWPTVFALAASFAACAPANRDATPVATVRPPAPPATTGQPEELTPAERAFLDARLDETIALLRDGGRDAGDGLLLAYALMLSGDDGGARKALEETMRAPHHADEHRFRSLLALLTGDLEGALAELSAGGRQRPFFSRVLHAEAAILARRFDVAQAETDALAAEFPDEPLVPHTRGHLESARGNWAAALDAYARSAALGGPNPDLDDGIAGALIALRQFADARRAIDRCRAAFPGYTEILYQAIRLERAKRGASGVPLGALVAEYRQRTRRQDRLVEVARWVGKS